MLQSAAAASALAAVPALAAGDEDNKLRTLLDAFWEKTLDASPQSATILGVDIGVRAGQRAMLNDATRAGRAAYIAARVDRLQHLTTIDPTRISPAARVDHDVVAYQSRVIADGGKRFRSGEGADGFGYIPFSP